MQPKQTSLRFFLPLVVLVLASLSGCQSIQSKLDSGQWESGPRFDEDGKFTDAPKATVPIWSSKDKD